MSVTNIASRQPPLKAVPQPTRDSKLEELFRLADEIYKEADEDLLRALLRNLRFLSRRLKAEEVPARICASRPRGRFSSCSMGGAGPEPGSER